MNKEEILEKSRAENKGKDYFELEVEKNSKVVALLTADFLLLIIFFLKIFSGNGLDHCIWAVVSSICAGEYIYKAVKLKDKKNILAAVMWTLTTLIVMGMALHYLFNPQSAEWLNNERYTERY